MSTMRMQGVIATDPRNWIVRKLIALIAAHLILVGGPHGAPAAIGSVDTNIESCSEDGTESSETSEVQRHRMRRPSIGDTTCSVGVPSFPFTCDGECVVCEISNALRANPMVAVHLVGSGIRMLC